MTEPTLRAAWLRSRGMGCRPVHRRIGRVASGVVLVAGGSLGVAAPATAGGHPTQFVAGNGPVYAVSPTEIDFATSRSVTTRHRW